MDDNYDHREGSIKKKQFAIESTTSFRDQVLKCNSMAQQPAPCYLRVTSMNEKWDRVIELVKTNFKEAA